MAEPQTLTCIHCGEPSDRPLHPGCSRLFVSSQRRKTNEAMRPRQDRDRAVRSAVTALLKERR